MRFPSRHPSTDAQPGIVGTARLDRRTTTLLRRLRPGDIAVIDHLDLDRHNAEALLERGPVAVVNASPFISGRYPNLGPELLARSGVALLDNVGSSVFTKVGDGAKVRLYDGQLFVDDDPLVSGRELDEVEVRAQMDQARTGLSTQLESFTHNTTEFLRREQDLLLHGQGAPDTRIRIEGRPVVIVVRRYDYRDDLKRLKRYIHEQRPVLVAVDDGADALVAAGHRPDLLVIGDHGLGQADSDGHGSVVSEKALLHAREVVLHTDRAGRALGSERLERLGVHPHKFAAGATSEDVAILLADQAGARLIVTVGMHATLDEFMDRQRTGLASTFLTRLRVGPKLVDAKSVPALYSGRVRFWQLLLVVVAGLVALLVAIGSTPVGQDWWDSARGALDDLVAWTQGLFS